MQVFFKRIVGQGNHAQQSEGGSTIKQEKLIATKIALLCFFVAISVTSNAGGADLGSFTNLQKAIEATKIINSDQYNGIKQMFDYGSRVVEIESKDGNVAISIIEDSCKSASEKADPDKYGCRKYQVTVTNYGTIDINSSSEKAAIDKSSCEKECADLFAKKQLKKGMTTDDCINTLCKKK